MTYRKLKTIVLKALQAEDLDAGLRAVRAIPPRQAVNPLFGLLYHAAPLVRWRAVSAMGEVVAMLAQEEFERSRIIMRRLMWNLNDESGGIGWGSPEAMGEIMARNRRLAEEYASILVCYLNPQANYLEHEGLQQGVLWAVGRLAGVHPDLTCGTMPLILPFLSSQNPILRGMGVWSGSALIDGRQAFKTRLETLQDDDGRVTLYLDGRLETRTIAALVRAVLVSYSMTR